MISGNDFDDNSAQYFAEAIVVSINRHMLRRPVFCRKLYCHFIAAVLNETNILNAFIFLTWQDIYKTQGGVASSIIGFFMPQALKS